MTNKTDVLLIGAGIMSATLATLLSELDPTLKITIIEALDIPAGESSAAWNNAGTGHAGLCELNYTPMKDGKIDIHKALDVTEQFEVSKQFWSYLTLKNILKPSEFIHHVPHMSFVTGDANKKFLFERHIEMTKHHFYQEMEYTDDVNRISSWAPLITNGRTNNNIALTSMHKGTDVNFGAITTSMMSKFSSCTSYNTAVVDIKKNNKNNTWEVKTKNSENAKNKIEANFVFIGAGGASLLLLEKANIKEGRGYGGFPVSGMWLKCINREIINKHFAKIYGMAEVGTPPMSMPHLDTRVINGQKELLFGPFAGFTTKFLMNGSNLDLPHSVSISNILPMLSAFKNNLPLSKYLIHQLSLSLMDRIEELKKFAPESTIHDWQLKMAGQRVQVIKNENGKGVIEFGTEIVNSADGTLATILGASPGASTSVKIIIDVIKKCFPKQYASTTWQNKFKEMIPSFGANLSLNKELFNDVETNTKNILNLI